MATYEDNPGTPGDKENLVPKLEQCPDAPLRKRKSPMSVVSSQRARRLFGRLSFDKCCNASTATSKQQALTH